MPAPEILPGSSMEHYRMVRSYNFPYCSWYEAAVKALLCGAAAVEVCTAIHREGFDVIARMNEWIDAWAARHGITALDEFKGRLGFGKSDSEFFQRVQYMKYFPGKD